MKNKVFISFGANTGNPLSQILQGLQALQSCPSVHHFQCSSIYQTPPMGPEQPNFLNGAARFEFTSGATDLLDLLQSIESSHGRDRQKETRWGPRPLDLDILLFKDQKILTDRLSIPHPGLIERVFVLVPLCELAPNLVLPNGLTTRSAVEVLDTTEIKQLYTDQGLPYGNNNTNPH